jgi:hypothetical protein
VNPSKFRAPFISKDEIEKAANEIRNRFKSTQRIPVEVLHFAEFDLCLEFDFANIHHLGYDAFLRPDLKGILFDRTIFTNPSYKQRLRFSTAHELAHFFLHKDIYGHLMFSSVQEWIKFIEAIPADQYYWIEQHAQEFAGRFLIPTKELSEALNETMQDAETEGLLTQGEEWVLEFCCHAIHSDFGVSYPAMQTRIRKSELWPHPKLPMEKP